MPGAVGGHQDGAGGAEGHHDGTEPQAHQEAGGVDDGTVVPLDGALLEGHGALGGQAGELTELLTVGFDEVGGRCGQLGGQGRQGLVGGVDGDAQPRGGLPKETHEAGVPPGRRARRQGAGQDRPVVGVGFGRHPREGEGLQEGLLDGVDLLLAQARPQLVELGGGAVGLGDGGVDAGGSGHGHGSHGEAGQLEGAQGGEDGVVLGGG